MKIEERDPGDGSDLGPEIIVLRGDHEVPAALPHEAKDALLAADGLLVAALVDGEGLGDHQRSVHTGVDRPQLLQLLGDHLELGLGGNQCVLVLLVVAEHPLQSVKLLLGFLEGLGQLLVLGLLARNSAV